MTRKYSNLDLYMTLNLKISLAEIETHQTTNIVLLFRNSEQEDLQGFNDGKPSTYDHTHGHEAEEDADLDDNEEVEIEPEDAEDLAEKEEE